MHNLKEFYKSINRFTKINTQSWLVDKLKSGLNSNLIPDYDLLYKIVKSILIHPIDAKVEKVKYDIKNRGIFHCKNSTVETILSYPLLQKHLNNEKLPLNTKPYERAVLSCDHHALLFTSFVRNLGIPIRVRTGYCKYIVDGLTVPHWVTEVYEAISDRWIIMDPERQIQNVEKSSFLFAAEIWKDHMENKTQYSSYSGLSGRQGLKYALLCDLNCIFKNELLSYEWRLKEHNRKKPLLVRNSYERLSEPDRKTIDSIAELMLDPDKNMNMLWNLYKKVVEDSDLEVSDYVKSI